MLGFKTRHLSFKCQSTDGNVISNSNNCNIKCMPTLYPRRAGDGSTPQSFEQLCHQMGFHLKQYIFIRGWRSYFFFKSVIKILIKFGACICVCMRTHTCTCCPWTTRAGVWSRAQLEDLALSFHRVGFRGRTSIFKLASSHLYLMGHLTAWVPCF